MLLIGGPPCPAQRSGNALAPAAGPRDPRHGRRAPFDTLTFTREHASWVDQSWGFDVLLALIVDSWGWPAAIGLASLGLAMLYAAVARGLIRDGTSPVVAVVVALLVTAISSIHFLIRPHLFTFAFVYLTFRACQKQHENGRLGGRAGADLHGRAGEPARRLRGAAGRSWRRPRSATPSRARGMPRAAQRASSSRWPRRHVRVAALANPYGFGLYRHVGNLLVSSGVTSLITEYQPAPFGKPEAQVLEWVLLAFIGLPVVSARRIDRYQLAHVLVWLHLALTSIRNAPLFALAAAPALATLLDGLPLAMRTSWKRDDRPSIWPAAATLGVLMLIMSGVNLGGFNKTKWPFGRAPRAEPSADGHPALSRTGLGRPDRGRVPAGAAVVRRRPLRAFRQGGDPRICRRLTGGPVWDTVRDRDRIEMVWLRPDRGLAKRLLKEPGWAVLYRDKVSILFRRGDGERAHGAVADECIVGCIPPAERAFHVLDRVCSITFIRMARC